MYYGFGISGTKIVFGVFDSGRQLQWEKRVPTLRDDCDAFLDAMCELIAEADRYFGYKGSVDIGIPGVPEIEDGTLYVTNVPAASDRPSCVDLNIRLDHDVRPDNDVNCFALSETRDDEPTQYPPAMGLILDIGVSGGLTFNSGPITGRGYIVDEFGHVRLPVDVLTIMGLDFPLRHYGCGQHGCTENYPFGHGFTWLYRHYYRQPLQAPKIVAPYDQSDKQARAHIERYLDLLAVYLGDILTIVDPDLIVTSDGLSNFPAITTQLVNRLPHHLLPVARVPRIERTCHGDAGGMRGVAFLHLAD